MQFKKNSSVSFNTEREISNAQQKTEEKTIGRNHLKLPYVNAKIAVEQSAVHSSADSNNVIKVPKKRPNRNLIKQVRRMQKEIPDPHELAMYTQAIARNAFIKSLEGVSEEIKDRLYIKTIETPMSS